jgi:membrane-associated phospholipid phosphatase
MRILDVLPIILYIIKLDRINNIVKFTLFVILNSIINLTLKQIIREPRPNNNEKRFNFDRYGMPSGHAQAVWFIVFYNLNKTNERITALLSVLALATCIQRIYTERHTLEQVIVGSFIGSMLGFMASKI